MYILKIKGSSKIPDYIQIRDNNFTLIAYFRADNPNKGLQQCRMEDKEIEVCNIIKEIPYGKIFELPF